MTDDFKKARDEAAKEKFGTIPGTDSFRFKSDANWAYVHEENKDYCAKKCPLPASSKAYIQKLEKELAIEKFKSAELEKRIAKEE